MAAPIKEDSAQTGNFRGFAVAIAVLVAVCGILAYAAYQPQQKSAPQVAGVATDEEYVAPEDTAPTDLPVIDSSKDVYSVTSVSDGDTIKVNVAGKTETVRLIGVDTPETKDPRKPMQCFGKEASDFTRKTLNGAKVRLEADSSQQDRDKYGRLLRYVYLQDGTLFNLLLIASGYAYEYTYKVPYAFQSTFKAVQSQAMSQSAGLWAATTCKGGR